MPAMNNPFIYIPSGMLKRLLAWTVDHAVQRKQFGHQLKEFAMIKEKFGRMAVNIYAMESMAYLTAGMLDGQQDPDCSVEAAIVKVREVVSALYVTSQEGG